MHLEDGRSILLPDLWIYISRNYLSKGDIANFSLVCHLFRESVLHLLFSHITIYGDKWDNTTGYSFRERFIQLHYTRHHLKSLLGKPELLPFIKTIEIRSWLSIFEEYVSGTEGRTVDLWNLLLSVWKSTSEQLVDLTVALPSLQTVTIVEADTSDNYYGRLAYFSKPLALRGDRALMLSFSILPNCNRALLFSVYSKLIHLDFESQFDRICQYLTNVTNLHNLPIIAAWLPPALLGYINPSLLHGLRFTRYLKISIEYWRTQFGFTSVGHSFSSRAPSVFGRAAYVGFISCGFRGTLCTTQSIQCRYDATLEGIYWDGSFCYGASQES